MEAPLFAFIMAGGSGERFWPMSRLSTPKQAIPLVSDRTLLEAAAARLEGILPPSRLYVLTNSALRGTVQRLLPALPPEQIIAEPDKRDTAPAAALATAIALRHDPRALLALLPSDQQIDRVDVFRRNLLDAAHRVRESDNFLTIAIPPTHPATGFGYLKLRENPISGPNGTPIHTVEQFVEKPGLDTAQSYLDAGTYAWNAGIFLWRAASFLREARRLQPALADFIEAYRDAPDPAPVLTTQFPTLPKISVDYGIMEHLNNIEAARAQFPWDDLGSWSSLAAHLPHDESGNATRGPVFPRLSAGNIAVSSGRAIALVGVNDLIVVETPDAVLVCHRSHAQDIKNLVSRLPHSLR